MLVLAVAACGESAPPEPVVPTVATVGVRASVPAPAPGDSVTLIAEPRDAGGRPVRGAPVVWSWSDSSTFVGAASGDTLRGRVVFTGTVRVVARAGAADGALELTVRWPDPAAVRFVLPTTDTVVVGSQRLVGAVAVDSAGRALPGVTPQVTSTDPTVVEVRGSSAGTRLHALRPGRAEIVAAVGALRAVWAVRVVPPPRYVWPDTSVLVPGLARALRLQERPDDQRATVLAAERWLSDAPGVATVAGDGTVTAAAPGRATVAAVLGGDTLRATVIVKAPAAGLRFVALAQGAPCAVSADGGVWCWGTDESGQLGTTEPVDRCESFQPFSGAGRFWYERRVSRCSALPVRAQSASRFVAATGTGSGVCALTDAGGVECWGALPAAAPAYVRRVPLPTPIAPGIRATAIDRTCLLDDRGAIHCWGSYVVPMFGDTTRAADAPRRVPSPVAFARFSVGGAHLCGVTAAAETYCWGSNYAGQVGVAASVQRPGCFTACETAPVRVAGMPAARDVRADALSATCALDLQGAAWCWGEQRANGRDAASPEPARVPNAPPFASLLSSPGGTPCGLTAGGEVWCWGSGHYRPDGSRASAGARAERMAPGFPVRTAVLDAARGCAIALDGTLACWGQGPLGDGAWPLESGPFRIARVAGQGP
ncbi:Ig-like domain-containing protein [Roseisolibacter sp. H3M3-2]|uniref:Ig-like domain-containing protein n=1 Tax=Roseisolibacter sp. H3M3-2 TaxID=3031323 RepID=UPI0023DCC25A|nr:Ig-like domain-containing protein [Roseisolibacter sp. H3M3-2]MDF1503495.1 Ig-like domain-containing protein [Roseisolibacter sp. H3M3-2]